MADVSKEIALEVSLKDSTGEGTKSAKQRLREMQKELIAMAEAGQQGTDAFKNLERQAGKLKDEIGDINQRIKNLASDTKRIDSVVSAIQGVAAGFQIAQGAAALFGDENEDLQKALVKVQGAMALSTGVQQVANLLQKESAVMMGLNALATNASTVAQKAYAIAVGTSTGAMRAFRIALAATGIGAAVVAVGFLVTALSNLKTQQDLAAESAKKQAKAQEDLTQSLAKTDKEIELNILRAKNAGKTEKQIADIEAQGYIERAKANEDFIAQSNKLLEKNAREKIALEVKANNPIEGETATERYQSRQQQLREISLELTQDNIDKKIKLELAGNKELNEKIKQADFDAQINREKAREIEIASTKSSNDKKIQETQNIAKELAAIQKKYADEAMLQKMGELRKELSVIDLKYAADLEKLKKHGQDTANLEAVIRQEKLNKEKEFAIQLRNIQQERADKQKEADDKTEQYNIARMQREGEMRKRQLESEKLIAEEIKRINKSVADYKEQVVTDSLNSITSILQAFGNKNKALAYAALLIEKGAGIANVIISLQKEMAANNLQASLHPLNLLTGGAAGLTYAAKLNTLAKIRAGLRIAAITATGIQAAQSISSGGGGGGGGTGGTAPLPSAGGAGGTAPAPSFANPQTTLLGNQGQPLPQPQGNQPMRAYVVERDIQQTTSRVRRLSEFATLG
jgi:hypothetical protein